MIPEFVSYKNLLLIIVLSLQAVSCLLACFVIFSKAERDYQAIKTEVNKSLLRGFTLIWPGLGQYLRFAVDVDS